MITTNLNKPTNPARAWFDLPVPATIAIVVFSLYLIAGLVWSLRSAPSVAAVPTPALNAIIIIASPRMEPPRPTPMPAAQVAAAPAGNVTQRVIGVFGGPDPATYIGSVEAGRAFVPIARFGSEWVQVDMSGGTGRVFVRTADLYGVPELVDLQPAPQPVIVDRPVYVVSAPAEAAPTPAADTYQITNADPPAPDFYSAPNTSIEDRQKLIGSDPNALACGGSPLCGGLTNAQAQAALDAERARASR